MSDRCLVDLSALKFEDFSLVEDRQFILTAPNDEALVLELVDAGTLAGSAGARRAFSLVFEGPRLPALPQSIYPVEHASVGCMEVFLVPIRETADHRYYEAVFG